MGVRADPKILEVCGYWSSRVLRIQVDRRMRLVVVERCLPLLMLPDW